MKLELDKSMLTEAINKLIPFVEKKTTIPILANVRIQATVTKAGGMVTLAGTTLDKSLTVTCPGTVESEGDCTIPAYKLRDILKRIKTIPEQQVTLESDNDAWVTVECGPFKVRLAGMKTEKYPSLPELPEVEWQARGQLFEPGMLAFMIGKVKHAIATQEWQYTLNGGMLKITSESVLLCSTDGHRLVHCLRNGQSRTINTVGGEIHTLIEGQSLERLAALDTGKSDIEFCRDTEGNVQFFRGDNWLMTSRVLNGQFPDYEAVIPKDHKAEIIVPVQALRDALGRVGMYADERSQAVRFSLIPGKGLELLASCTEQGEASELIPVPDYTNTQALSLGFKADYVLDALSTMGKRSFVVLQLRDATSAGVWMEQGTGTGTETGEYQTKEVLMPMRM